MHLVYYQVFGCNPTSFILVSCSMVQNPSDQAVQSAPIGAANSGVMNDTMDVDADLVDPAAAVADAVADAAEDPPPPPPPPSADAYVPITPFCSACHVPLMNRTNEGGQMYRVLPNCHTTLSTRQIIHLLHHPTLIRFPVPVCYCCTTDMVFKAYVDLLASQRDTPGAIEITDDMYGIDRAPPRQ